MLTAIDQIANRNHLQMFKAAIPYLPKENQKFFSFYIKFLELQNVMSFFSAQPGRLQSCSAGEEGGHLSDMLNDIRNFCDDNEKKMIDQISNLMTTMELFSMMMENEESEADHE